jgi:methylated-DNA-protein-cysteine methyltransferase-like protein
VTDTTRRIIEAIRTGPRGRVSCYRDIALAAGLPNGARQVVRILHSMSKTERLPWYRIVRADGHIALPPGGGMEQQTALLRSEGVRVSASGRVDPAFRLNTHQGIHTTQAAATEAASHPRS